MGSKRWDLMYIYTQGAVDLDKMKVGRVHVYDWTKAAIERGFGYLSVVINNDLFHSAEPHYKFI